MTDNNPPTKEIKLNNNVIAIGSAFFSAWYQYEEIVKSNKVYTPRVKAAYMIGSGIICFFMTKFILDNYVNKIKSE